MKITEIITPINANRTILGDQNISLTLDTDTNEVAIDTPAMFVDPVVNFDELQAGLAKLAAVRQDRQ